jgi:hypothetical protein
LSDDEVVTDEEPGDEHDGAVPEEVPPTDLATETPPPDASRGDQLSLDEMVDSLRDPEQDADTTSDAPETVPVEGEAAEAEVAEADGATSDAAAEAAPATGDREIGSAGSGTDDVPGLARQRTGARLPFWLYAGAWLLFAVGMSVALWPDATSAFTALPLYTWFVLGGAALAVLGPVIALVVWLVIRSGSDPDERAGLVRALLLRASLAMLTGSLLWWAALVLLDLRRAGLLG